MQQQRDVFCGGIKEDQADDALFLDIAGHSGSSGKIKLQIERLSKKLAQDIPDLLVDLVEIATYVYCADQLTRRETPFMTAMGSSWRRRFRFVVPVRRPEIWMLPEVRAGLVSTLRFLSEDEYAFDFRKSTRKIPLQSYLPFEEPPLSGDVPMEVVLFSGGLDSLAGAVQAVLADATTVLLVSHQSSNMIASKQRELVSNLRSRSEGRKVQHVSIVIGKGGQAAVEYTQRTRSFLFAALGFVVARMHSLCRLQFYENGVVSINLPLSDHIIGARASRTTHPQFLKSCGDLFSILIERRFEISNPYLWWTKADVVRSLFENNCADLISSSFSCASVREATRIGKHCGVCSQCVDRRFGILAAGLEAYDVSGNYSFDLLLGQHRHEDHVTLSESFVSRAQRLSTMPLERFVSTYGQIFRVMAALPISAEASAKQIWELHLRHAKDVVKVVEHALSQVNLGELPVSSLLSIVSGASGDLIVDNQAKEAHALKVEQANKQQQSPQILLGIDPSRQTVLFEGGIKLGGDHYAVLSELASQLETDRLAGKHPDERGFISGDSLARRWKIEEASVRRRIQRARDALSGNFVRHLGRPIVPADLIQNVRPRGYRLNPTVALVDPSILERA